MCLLGSVGVPAGVDIWAGMSPASLVMAEGGEGGRHTDHLGGGEDWKDKIYFQ